jgi:hypothetical protein
MTALLAEGAHRGQRSVERSGRIDVPNLDVPRQTQDAEDQRERPVGDLRKDDDLLPVDPIRNDAAGERKSSTGIARATPLSPRCKAELVSS